MSTALHQRIAQMVPEGSHVLDLGCGDGALLSYLKKTKKCTGYGVELADENVLACVQRGVNVIQANLDAGLSMFRDQSFDVILQIETLQHLRNTETMLRETVRVGRMGIVAFPNFAHWPNRWAIMQGSMPVTKTLPYQWYDTPNIRVGTYRDFRKLAEKNNLDLIESFGWQGNQQVDWLPNARASMAIFSFKSSFC